MQNLPLITVIIPVYNVKEYLQRCVSSVTAQTYQNLEIILVDDGSTDGSGKLCDRFAEQDPRIRVAHKQNGGSSSARNLGLSMMHGEFVGFVDSDDYIEPEMYEKLYQGMLNSWAPIIQVGRDEIDETGKGLPEICHTCEEETIIKSEDFMKELLMHRGDCSFCTKLFRSGLLKNLRFPVGKLNEDFNLLIRILPSVEEILQLPFVGYHVFYRMGSNSRREINDFSHVFEDSVVNAEVAGQIVNEYYPKLQETVFRFGMFQRLEYLLHIPISKMNYKETFYIQVVAYIRKNWGRAMINRYLTLKNKLYLTLFAIAPATLRKIHRKLKGKR